MIKILWGKITDAWAAYKRRRACKHTNTHWRHCNIGLNKIKVCKDCGKVLEMI